MTTGNEVFGKMPCSICGKISTLTNLCDCYVDDKAFVYIDQHTPLEGIGEVINICSVCGHVHRRGGSVCNCAGKVPTPKEELDRLNGKTILGPANVITTGSIKLPKDSTLIKKAKEHKDLTDLYNELGTLKWASSDAGWNEAIEAIRIHIKGKII